MKRTEKRPSFPENSDEMPEDILLKLDAHQQGLIYAIPDIVYFKDTEGRHTIVNKSFEEFTGLRSEEITGKTDEQLFPPEMAAYFKQTDQEVIKERKTIHCDEKSISRDGKVVWFETIKSPLYDDQGTLVGIVGITRDITSRKKTEEQLHLFRVLLDHSNDALFIVDPIRGHFLDVNDTACNRLGYSRSELLNMRMMDIQAVIPDQISWESILKEVRSWGSVSREGSHKRKDGTSFPVEVSVTITSQNNREYLVASARDITERKQEEAKYRAMLLSAMDGFCIVNSGGRFIDANPSFCDLLGFSRDEILRMHISDIEAMETPEEVIQHVRRARESGCDHFETRHRRKDGSIVDVEVRVRYADVWGGQIYAFVRESNRHEGSVGKKTGQERRTRHETAQ